MTVEHDSNRPIWALPQPAERKPRYTRDQIADVALRLADQEGFEAVTMKRIAAELGAGTMTLYYYVRNKTDIVALMQDAILAEVIVPADELPTGWRDAAAAIARRTRQVLMAHPWSMSSLNDAQFGPNAMRHMEQSLTAMAGTGLSGQARLELLAVVDNYVFGNALHSIETLDRARAAQANPGMVTAVIEYSVTLLQTGEFPELNALYQAGASGAERGVEGEPEGEAEGRAEDEAAGPPMAEASLEAAFERGLQALLDGIAARWGLASGATDATARP
ncbi:MAG TPA: TetR/AcrR family transcriptional regulator [Streptosporangiaceae bacterium]